jgi:hypothetical protein
MSSAHTELKNPLDASTSAMNQASNASGPRAVALGARERGQETIFLSIVVVCKDKGDGVEWRLDPTGRVRNELASHRCAQRRCHVCATERSPHVDLLVPWCPGGCCCLRSTLLGPRVVTRMTQHYLLFTMAVVAALVAMALVGLTLAAPTADLVTEVPVRHSPTLCTPGQAAHSPSTLCATFRNVWCGPSALTHPPTLPHSLNVPLQAMSRSTCTDDR